jgi:hypothetical protein
MIANFVGLATSRPAYCQPQKMTWDRAMENALENMRMSGEIYELIAKAKDRP